MCISPQPFPISRFTYVHAASDIISPSEVGVDRTHDLFGSRAVGTVFEELHLSVAETAVCGFQIVRHLVSDLAERRMKNYIGTICQFVSTGGDICNCMDRP